MRSFLVGIWERQILFRIGDGVKFRKYQAIGNDYIVISEEDFDLPESNAMYLLAQKICDRKYGVGSDGLLVFRQKVEDASSAFRLSIINPDGSEAEKSGNGIRIFSRYLWDKGYISDEPFDVLTSSEKVTSQILDNGSLVSVDMGKPHFYYKNEAFKEVITYEGMDIPIFRVSMGNPHCIIFSEDVKGIDFFSLGPYIEAHSMFENRTNVQFVDSIGSDFIDIRIWERGAGHTLSSGSSSCAVFSVCRSLGLVDSSVRINMEGGTLNLKQVNDNVIMEGEVKLICEGEYYDC